MYVYVCICMYMYVYVCMHVHAYTFICRHYSYTDMHVVYVLYVNIYMYTHEIHRKLWKA